MPDSTQATRIETATKMMLAECEGESYEIRRRFGILIPTLRGHKIAVTNLVDQPTGSVGQCEICGQVVKVPREGKSIEGRAVENDCPAAVWKRP
jgi:hypothetical protein